MAKHWKNLVSAVKGSSSGSSNHSLAADSTADNEDENDVDVPQIVEKPVMIGSETLSVFQKRLLGQTWSHMNKSGSGGGIGSVIFKKILDKRPELRQMLQKAAVVNTFAGASGPNLLVEHKRQLTELLTRTIDNLDDLSIIAQECTEIGKAHAHLHGRNQFQPDFWDKFGQVMLESFTQLETIRRHRELVKAWMVLISFLIDKMRHGYVMRMKQMQFHHQRLDALSSTMDSSLVGTTARCCSAEESSGVDYHHRMLSREELEQEERVSD